MKKLLVGAMTLLLSATLFGCGTTQNNTNQAAGGTSGNAKTVTLKVGATPVPHAEILEHVKPELAKEGINLDIVTFNDYVQPNLQLASGQLDANYFQHVPYLDQFNKDHKLDLTYLTKVHIEPMGAYSKKYKSKNDLPNGATIAIPNDVTNAGRALALLQANGLIQLKAGVGVNATVHDIVQNPKNFKITELDAAMLPRVLPSVDLAVINTNYALDAKLNPTKDALFIEDKNSPYANVLAIRSNEKNNPALQKLAQALNSADTKQFIEQKYQGSIVPAF